MTRIGTLGALVATVVLISSCSHSSKKAEPQELPAKTEEPAITFNPPEEDPGPPPEEIAEWRSVNVSEGMARQEVEEKLGEPAHLSRTKDNQLYIMYELGSHWRSVIYDDHGKVVAVYP